MTRIATLLLCIVIMLINNVPMSQCATPENERTFIDVDCDGARALPLLAKWSADPDSVTTYLHNLQSSLDIASTNTIHDSYWLSNELSIASILNVMYNNAPETYASICDFYLAERTGWRNRAKLGLEFREFFWEPPCLKFASDFPNPIVGGWGEIVDNTCVSVVFRTDIDTTKIVGVTLPLLMRLWNNEEPRTTLRPQVYINDDGTAVPGSYFARLENYGGNLNDKLTEIRRLARNEKIQLEIIARNDIDVYRRDARETIQNVLRILPDTNSFRLARIEILALALRLAEYLELDPESSRLRSAILTDLALVDPSMSPNLREILPVLLPEAFGMTQAQSRRPAYFWEETRSYVENNVRDLPTYDQKILELAYEMAVARDISPRLTKGWPVIRKAEFAVLFSDNDLLETAVNAAVLQHWCSGVKEKLNALSQTDLSWFTQSAWTRRLWVEKTEALWTGMQHVFGNGHPAVSEYGYDVAGALGAYCLWLYDQQERKLKNNLHTRNKIVDDERTGNNALFADANMIRNKSIQIYSSCEITRKREYRDMRDVAIYALMTYLTLLSNNELYISTLSPNSAYESVYGDRNARRDGAYYIAYELRYKGRDTEAVAIMRAVSAVVEYEAGSIDKNTRDSDNRLYPTDIEPRALRYLVEKESFLGNWDRAAQYSQQLVTIGGAATTEDWDKLAKIHIKRGDYAAAEATILTSMEHEVNTSEVPCENVVLIQNRIIRYPHTFAMLDRFMMLADIWEKWEKDKSTVSIDEVLQVAKQSLIEASASTDSILAQNSKYGDRVSYELGNLKIKQDKYLARLTLAMGRRHIKNENTSQALRLYSDAISIFQSTLTGTDELRDLKLAYAQSLIESGRYAEAVQPYRDVLYSNVTGSASQKYDEREEMEIHSRLAYVWLLQGEYEAAHKLFKNVSNTYEAIRHEVRPGLRNAGFANPPYAALALCKLEVEDIDSVWTSIERGRGRVLSEIMHVESGAMLTPTERAKADTLRNRIADVQTGINILENTTDIALGVIEETRLKELKARLHLLEVEWFQLQKQLEAKYPVNYGQNYDLERIRNTLPPKTAIMGWVDLELPYEKYLSWVYVLPPEGDIRYERLSADTESGDGFLALVDSLQQLLTLGTTSEETIDQLLNVVSRRRVGNALDNLAGVERLIVVPGDLANRVPVELLCDSKGTPLHQRFEVSYAPSGTVLASIRERPRGSFRARPDLSALLIGDPMFTPAVAATNEEERRNCREAMRGNAEALRSLPRLPGSRYEVEKIAELVANSTVLLGAEATEENITRLARERTLQEYDIIHIATHAFVDSEMPERSCLIFSQAELPDAWSSIQDGYRVYDGRISMEEVQQEWHLDADLVVLSACETGLGRQVYGEGVVGFSWALLQAGARSLVVSLWKVQDEVTKLFMQRFYTNYLKESGTLGNSATGIYKSKAWALQEAKQWIREWRDANGDRLYSHPYFWAGFVLIGDPE